MKRTLAASAFLAVLLAGCAGMHEGPGSAAAPGEAKMAFDITSGDPQVVNLTLTVIEMTRKQLIAAGMTPRIVVAFRGDASYFTQDSLAVVKDTHRAHAIAVKAKIRDLKAASGVEGFEQCNVPLASRKLKGTDLMKEVKLVPNGWITLANYQQKGYAYIVP
jgi:intracellular sulfur oxidation DsrE/DsrF family protein